MKSLEKYFRAIKGTLKTQSELQERIEDNMILNKLKADMYGISPQDQELQIEMSDPKNQRWFANKAKQWWYQSKNAISFEDQSKNFRLTKKSRIKNNLVDRDKQL